MIGTIKTYCYVGVFFVVGVCAFFTGAALDSAAHLIAHEAYQQGQSEIIIGLPIEALQHIEVHDVGDIARDI